MDIRIGSLCLLLCLGLALGGCKDKGGGDSGGEDGGASARIEGTEVGDCTDSADNDADGLFDCDDSGCKGSPDCKGTGDGGGSAGDGGGDDGGGGDTGGPDPRGVDDDGDGFTENAGDCDDTNELIHPGASDIVGDKLDLNCDGVDGEDADDDGHASTGSGGGDCNDGDPEINPAALEGACDGIDDDCDGLIDDGAICDLEVIHGDDPSCESFGHAYLLATQNNIDLAGWTDARSWCLERGYDLLVVDDECEWDWFEVIAAAVEDGTNARSNWWPGLACDSGCTDSDNYYWVDGSDGYTHWLGGMGTDYDCAQLRYVSHPGLYLTPDYCSTEKQWVCEAG